MNPMTNVKNIKKLSEQELKFGGKSSWHDQYKDSAWIFVGGLPYDLTEGDIICIFSQYGEIVNLNLVRDKETGKQKGFCFVCYEDQKSTILAVDNLNAIKILGRTLRVDHVENYKAPKEGKKNPIDDETRQLWEEGCAPSSRIAETIANKNKPPEVKIKQEKIDTTIKQEPFDDIRLPPRLPIAHIKQEPIDKADVKIEKSKKKHKEKSKKSKKDKKTKKSKKQKRHSSSSSDSSSSSSTDSSEDDRRRRKHKK